MRSPASGPDAAPDLATAGSAAPTSSGSVTQGRGERGEGRSSAGVRQRPVEHQLPDVLEAAALCQLDGGVLAVVVEALAPPDVPEHGVGDDDAREATGYVDG